MMRIGIHAAALLPYRTGRENYVQSLLAALAEIDDRNQYTVIASTANRHLFERPESNFRCVELKLPRLPSRRVWEIAYLHLSAVARDLDVVLLTEAPVPFYQPSKAIACVHDVLPMLYPQHFPLKGRLYYQKAFSLGMRHLGMITSSSENTKSDIVQHYGIEPERICVIPHAANPAIMRTDDKAALRRVREKYSLPERFALYVGTLEPRKNLPRLVDALAALRRAGEDIDLVLAGGKGWLYDDILQHAEQADIVSHVHFTGFVDDGDMAALYSLAGVFAFPSLYEGFGVPPLEAMACGVPVVCSNRSSIPEVVGNAALLVDPEDEGALADAMRMALTDKKLRRRLCEAGLARAKLFTWQRTARETLALFEEFVSRNASEGGVRNAA